MPPSKNRRRRRARKSRARGERGAIDRRPQGGLADQNRVEATEVCKRLYPPLPPPFFSFPRCNARRQPPGTRTTPPSLPLKTRGAAAAASEGTYGRDGRGRLCRAGARGRAYPQREGRASAAAPGEPGPGFWHREAHLSSEGCVRDFPCLQRYLFLTPGLYLSCFPGWERPPSATPPRYGAVA